jgi:hypothetical protein
MTPRYKEELKKEFAAFLRKSIEQPISEIPKEFRQNNYTFTVATIRNYCDRVLREGKDMEKIKRIKDFYELRGIVNEKEIGKDRVLEMTETEKLLHELEKNKDKARPVANLFNNNITNPTERSLSFAAFLINLPISSLEDFKKFKATLEPTIEENTTPSSTEITTSNPTEPTPISNQEKEAPSTTTQATTVNEVSTPATAEKTTTFWYKHKSKVLVAASLLLVAISAYAYRLHNYIEEKKDQLAYIHQISFTPVVADSGLLEASVSAESTVKVVNTTTVTTDNPLVFYTNNIYNGKFLYTTDKWDFATDQNGEDMNSPYGEPYKDQLKGLFKTPNNLPTIANKSIWLRFNVLNKGSQKLYIDNIKLEKVGTYKINPQKVKWNNWITPKDGEKRFELLLSHEPQVAAIVAFAEVPPQNPQHFSLLIHTDTTCESYIYKFRLVVSANDAQGRRYTTTSDKVYSIGRLSEL